MDLTKEFKEFIDINIGEIYIPQRILYINLPNTCYYYQSTSHKIKDFLVMVEKFKDNTSPPPPMFIPSTSQNRGGQEEWTIVPK